MKVYRIGWTKHADDLSGEGSKLFGGRWNHKGIPCIYTSESRALALLEYSVNVNIDEIPRALSCVTIEIPNRSIKLISENKLPGNWKNFPAPSDTKDLGSKLLSALKVTVIKIPSSIIKEEFNYLLNPLHAPNKNFKVVDIKDFIYDVRIKKA
ncbi:MAG TPA: RES family NAD+ phosphorylase [Ginsengibacter sp.]|nr:RES family NAD+ phosphorylase [Ginsengibacter sp.]